MMKKKVMLCMFAILMVGMLSACGKKEEEASDGTTGLANPFIDCVDMKEAADLAGFSFEVPETIDGYEGKKIQAIESDLIQVFYGDVEGANILVRKATGSDDISGDYNEYSEKNAMTVNEIEVETREENGSVMVAIWSMDGYTYAIDATDGIAPELVTLLVTDLK